MNETETKEYLDKFSDKSALIVSEVLIKHGINLSSLPDNFKQAIIEIYRESAILVLKEVLGKNEN